MVVVNDFYDELSHLMDISGIVYNEKQRLQKKEKGIQTALDSQKRMIFLNQSYATRMREYSFMIMIIAITIVIVVFILMFKDYLPSFLITFLIMLVSSIGFIWVFKVYIGIQYRDNVDFDKIYSPPAKLDTSGNALANSIAAGDISEATKLQWNNKCIGSECCSGNMIYDTSKDKCLSPFTSLEQAYQSGEIQINTDTIQYYNNMTSSLSFTPFLI